MDGQGVPPLAPPTSLPVAGPPAWRECLALARTAVILTAALTLVAGLLYPLAVVGLGQTFFPTQAQGSLVRRGPRVIGSSLIAQSFTSSRYFHPRPSGAGAGYDPLASGGANLGPLNIRLLEGSGGDGLPQLARNYRAANGVPADVRLPPDAVTRSGSGLDPHISPANASLQVHRVAWARGVSEDSIRRLVAEHTEGRQLGFLGEPRVNVFALNLALDAAEEARRR